MSFLYTIKMLEALKSLKASIKDIMREEIIKLKSMDLFVVTGVNEESLTVNIKRFNVNESYDDVELLGLGLGHGKGQIKLPEVNDVVLVTFVANSQKPIILGTLFDVYSSVKDTKIDVKLEEYFVNNKLNGSYLFIDENNNIIFKTPNGAKIRLNEDGSFKLYNKDNYGIDIDSSGNLVLRGVSIEHTQTPGPW